METEKKKLDLKKLAFTLFLVLLTAGAVGGGVYYVLNQNFQQEREANEKAFSDINNRLKKLAEKDSDADSKDTSTSTTDQNLTEARNIAENLETAQKNIDPKTALSLFSAAQTTEEKDFYNFLVGADIPGGSYRLYGTSAYSFKMLSHKEVSNSKTIDGYKFVISEERSVYNNATTTWTTTNKNKVIIVKKIGTSWLIDKYYNENVENSASPNGTLKYNGFYS